MEEEHLRGPAVNNLYIYCEGATERTFVEDKLYPYLLPKGIAAFAVLAGDGRSRDKVGISGYHQVKRELTRLCREHPNGYVTTLIYYSPPLNVDFDYDQSGSISDQIANKERGVEQDIGFENLMMHFQQYEFEAIFFSCPDAFDGLGKNISKTIRRIADEAGGPEFINTSPNSMPSKRLDKIIPGYRKTKVYHTQMLLEKMSLKEICSGCDHFRQWIERIIRVCGEQPE